MRKGKTGVEEEVMLVDRGRGSSAGLRQKRRPQLYRGTNSRVKHTLEKVMHENLFSLHEVGFLFGVVGGREDLLGRKGRALPPSMCIRPHPTRHAQTLTILSHPPIPLKLTLQFLHVLRLELNAGGRPAQHGGWLMMTMLA